MRVTFHYHGTPIHPPDRLTSLTGRRFTVAFRSHQGAPEVERLHRIASGVMLDNGAFSAWTRGRLADWQAYYRWAERWLDRATTWAVIPDVIGGDDADNDALVGQWPHGQRGTPVWHMHESIARLLRLAERWPRVAVGSSERYRVVGSSAWHNRMVEAMNALCGDGPPPCALHMLRGMQMAGSIYPFDSVDSADIARNVNRGVPAVLMAERWERRHCPTTWQRRMVQHALPL